MVGRRKRVDCSADKSEYDISRRDDDRLPYTQSYQTPYNPTSGLGRLQGVQTETERKSDC